VSGAGRGSGSGRVHRGAAASSDLGGFAVLPHSGAASGPAAAAGAVGLAVHDRGRLPVQAPSTGRGPGGGDRESPRLPSTA